MNTLRGSEEIRGGHELISSPGLVECWHTCPCGGYDLLELISFCLLITFLCVEIEIKFFFVFHLQI